MALNEDKAPIVNFFHNYYQHQPQQDNLEFKHTTDKQVFEFLLKNGNVGKTREQICSELNLPRSSVYDSLTRLNIAHMIEIDYKKNKLGRPSTLYFLKNFTQGRNR